MKPRPNRAEAKAANVVMKMALSFYRNNGPGTIDRCLFRGMQLAVRMMMDALPVCRKHERRMEALRSLEKRTARILDRIDARRKRAGVAR